MAFKDNYTEIKAEARKLANEFGNDHGIAKHAFGYYYFMLPRRENRFGHELRCEVVSADDLAKCKPGHGPIRK